jgi:hypothetical protein
MAYYIRSQCGESTVDESTEQTDGNPMPDRWTLIRDIVVLQFKLVVDGLRDFILVPISLVVGLVSLIRSDEEGGAAFYELLRAGRRSERWINLFGAADRVQGPSLADDVFPDQDIDELVSRVETFVVDEYSRGGVTSQAKAQLDRALDSLRRMASRKERGETDNGEPD